MPHSRDTLAIIMAGGVGSRLSPLTRDRAKPAVPFAGQYRIIDFTLSNCLHSRLRQVYVLTQYKSDSMHRHLRDGWSAFYKELGFHSELGEHITAVPPQQRTGGSWYAGTADAVFQNVDLIRRSGAKNVIVLSGDHVYRMDYRDIIAQHNRTGADLTVACLEVSLDDARGFGVMSVDNDNRIYAFHEKPGTPQPLPDDSDHALASMGVYVFSADMLCEELIRDHADENSTHDFGNDLMPRLIHSHKVYGYRFGSLGNQHRYWKDVGTIDSYFDANMDLLKTTPPLDLHSRDWPIRKYDTPTPPARICKDGFGLAGEVSDSILSNGVIVQGGVVEQSVLSPGVEVKSGAIVERCVLMDGVKVGQGTLLRNCIVDKDVAIPDGETIGVDQTMDAERFTISDKGIVVIPKNFDFPTPSPRPVAEVVKTFDRPQSHPSRPKLLTSSANSEFPQTRSTRSCAR